jgi:hypothetical protein
MASKTKTRKPKKAEATTTQSFPPWLHSYVETLVEQLKLSHWNIALDSRPCDENCWADITITPAQSTATIALAANWREWTREEMRETLTHELLHCHLNPMCELVQELTDDHAHSATLNKAVDYSNERTTDALTNLVAPYMALPVQKSKARQR